MAFDYERVADARSAVRLLDDARGTAKILAGGQSLGPMLNLRLAQPSLLVDVRKVEELGEIREATEELVIGACVTHAAIEDGVVPDVTRGFLRTVAHGIAYRAIRNRGTIGGSLCHADPSADWVTALFALDANVLVLGPKGRREVPVQSFVRGPFSTGLDDAELVTAIRVPKLSPLARWSYYKFSRKPGEFAEAIAAIVVDPARAMYRVVLGATNGMPHILADAFDPSRGVDDQTLSRWVREAGLHDDPYTRRVHTAALRRAVQQLRQEA
ncbi:MAG TPA: FAD binding domain-containing protein [Sandaracinaceae bacterium]